MADQTWRFIYFQLLALLFFSAALYASEPRHCGLYTYAPPFASAPAGYTARYHTIAHELLDSERGIGPVTSSEYAILDSLLDETKEKLTPTPANLDGVAYEKFAVESLRTVDCILASHGFVFPGSGEVQLLSDALDPTNFAESYYQIKLLANPHNAGREAFIKKRKPGPYYVVDGDVASYIYLAVGQVMGYPLAMVPVPGHAFVRWALPNGKFIDFETMDGKETSDGYYRDRWSIRRRFVHSYGILDSMTIPQLVGHHYLTLGIAATWKEDYTGAIAQFEKSLSVDAADGEAANDLAWLYTVVPAGQLRNPKKAILYAEQAVAISNDGDSLDTLACAYALAGDFPRAITTEKQALHVGVSQKDVVQANLEQITAKRTCEDPTFGKDRLPFRPREHPSMGAK